MRAELDLRKEHYNNVRLHEGIGYVTPQDEHTGRGPAIRAARRTGLEHARTNRIAHRRNIGNNQPSPALADGDN